MPVVVVNALRTPICKANKGKFKDTTPDDLLKIVLEKIVAQADLKKTRVQDIIVANVQQAGSYAGPARMAMLRAGFPPSVPIYSINRQCSSGLQAVANAAAAIYSGDITCAIAAGVESMTSGGNINKQTENSLPPANWNDIASNALARDCLIPMGVTAEIVAERYGISREDQDEWAVASHAKALIAQNAGYFDQEIVPVSVHIGDDNNGGDCRTVTVYEDEGPRPGTSPEVLARLRPVFKEDGTVTAGTSSQVSDGAAAVLLMSQSMANKLGKRPLGTLLSYRVVGVPPDEMGVGPAVAIPAALDAAGIGLEEVDIFEINEAFAAQVAYCVRKLGIHPEKVNPVGGAIALGHPLGCTGTRQVATLLYTLRRLRKRYGVISMCVGTGMGAAAVFESMQ